ncbi:MAG: DinB family protein [Planctomycetota bacterium]
MNPQLDPPGAGLPERERRVASIMLWTGSRLISRKRVADMFLGESRKIETLCLPLSPEQAKCRVLIDRIMGIEDNSRNWSVYMVLEHLVIVNGGITSLIESLNGGQAFGREVRIEDVKPKPTAGEETVGALESSVKQLLQTVESIERFSTAAKHRHPWFGQMNSQQWFTLAAVHMRVHRKQIEGIIAGL